MKYYNAYDCIPNLFDLPQSLAAIEPASDFQDPALIKQFTTERILSEFEYALAMIPIQAENLVQIYENAGFIIYRRVDNVFWMIAHKTKVRLSITDSINLEIAFRKYFLPNDSLWIFGSRADLSRKGGDIDIYIESHVGSIDEGATMKTKFWNTLQQMLGEQKIDIILNVLGNSQDQKIFSIAKQTGAKII